MRHGRQTDPLRTDPLWTDPLHSHRLWTDPLHGELHGDLIQVGLISLGPLSMRPHRGRTALPQPVVGGALATARRRPPRTRPKRRPAWRAVRRPVPTPRPSRRAGPRAPAGPPVPEPCPGPTAVRPARSSALPAKPVGAWCVRRRRAPRGGAVRPGHRPGIHTVGPVARWGRTPWARCARSSTGAGSMRSPPSGAPVPRNCVPMPPASHAAAARTPPCHLCSPVQLPGPFQDGVPPSRVIPRQWGWNGSIVSPTAGVLADRSSGR